MSTGRSTRRQSEGTRWESVLVCCAILVVVDVACAFQFGVGILSALIIVETGFGVAILDLLRAEKESRRERQRRERSALGTYYRGYFARRDPSDQEAEELEAHRAEEKALRVRIAELEDQLAHARDDAGIDFSEVSEGPDEKEKPEVVAVIEVRGALQPKTGRPGTKATGKRPIARGAGPAGVRKLRAEQDELTIRRKAIGVLLAALDDAVTQGILTQADYKAKRSKYDQELRRIDKSLKVSSKVDKAS